MFDYQGPIGAINAQRGYILANYADLAEAAQPRFLALSTERDVAKTLIDGLETLYAACRELVMPNRDAALTALGETAAAVYQDNLWSAADRAYAIMRWAKAERDGVPDGVSPPAAPDIGEGKSFAPA